MCDKHSCYTYTTTNSAPAKRRDLSYTIYDAVVDCIYELKNMPLNSCENIEKARKQAFVLNDLLGALETARQIKGMN